MHLILTLGLLKLRCDNKPFNSPVCSSVINPLPDMPILGPSNSAANKDMMSKIWTNVDTII